MSGQINDGGPAFPGVEKTEYPSCVIETPYPGMTLRDYFAAKAMAGLLTARHPDHFGQDGAEVLANDSYAIADAMLEARKS